MTSKIQFHCKDCPARCKNVFHDAKNEILDQITNAKSLHLYQKKQIIHFQGHPSFGIYCIRSGRIKVHKTTSEGKQYIMRLEGAGSLLGLSTLFTDSPYLWTAEALEETEVCFISKQAILSVINTDSQTRLRLFQELGKLLEESEEERTDLAYSSVRERMARELTILAENYGIPTTKGVLIRLDLSREELAELIGTAPETAIRLLKNFKEEHLLEIKGRDIIVLNCEQLRQASQMQI